MACSPGAASSRGTPPTEAASPPLRLPDADPISHLVINDRADYAARTETHEPATSGRGLLMSRVSLSSGRTYGWGCWFTGMLGELHRERTVRPARRPKSSMEPKLARTTRRDPVSVLQSEWFAITRSPTTSAAAPDRIPARIAASWSSGSRAATQWPDCLPTPSMRGIAATGAGKPIRCVRKRDGDPREEYCYRGRRFSLCSRIAGRLK